MRLLFRRKAEHFRHAIEEFRAGDGRSRRRSGPRTATVGGRPPEEACRVPMGIERVLRKAAADPRFHDRLRADRAAAIEASGLTLTPSERAILLAAPGEQIRAMVLELAPSSPARRGLFRRLLAAAGLALLGPVAASCGPEPAAGGAQPDLPPGVTNTDARDRAARAGGDR
jgi:hypothetical protein